MAQSDPEPAPAADHGTTPAVAEPGPEASAEPTATTTGSSADSKPDSKPDSERDSERDSEPDPKTARPEAGPKAAPEAEPGTEADSGAEAEKEKDEPEEDPAERARRTVRAFEWSCGWLTLLAGAFVLSGMVQADETFGGLAWVGAIVVFVCVLALIALYVGCALDRITLRTRVLGSVDLFQASTVVVVLAVIFGLVVPSDNHSALSLLLPWALTYWIYGMDRAKPPAE